MLNTDSIPVWSFPCDGIDIEAHNFYHRSYYGIL